MPMTASAMRGMDPNIRELVEAALEQGWDANRTGSGHLRLTTPAGDPVFGPWSPSDPRAWLAFRAELRRHGLVAKHQKERRRRVAKAVHAQPVRDPQLEELTQELLDQNERMEDLILALIRRLHDQDEAGRHGWDPERCTRTCAEALRHIQGGEPDGSQNRTASSQAS
jgi:hypothetical protein